MTLVSVDRLVNLDTDLKKGVHSSIFLGRISFHKIVALFTAGQSICNKLCWNSFLHGGEFKF